MQSCVTLCIIVSLLHFDILWNLIAFDDALNLTRPQQQYYPPAVLSSAFWKVGEKGGCFPFTMFMQFIIS